MKRINIAVWYDESTIDALAIEKHIWNLYDDIEGMVSTDPVDSAAIRTGDGDLYEIAWSGP